MRAMESESLSEFPCLVCSKLFQSAGHLRRHTLSHSDSKPYVCQFCQSRYKRGDALRRHWINCTKRIAGGHLIPQRDISGKRKQACDCCTLRKRACSTDQPCSECWMRGTECTYARVRRKPHQSTPDVQPEEASLGSGGIGGSSIGKSGHESKYADKEDHDSPKRSASSCQNDRFAFLANFTTAMGLKEAYNYHPEGEIWPPESELLDTMIAPSPDIDQKLLLSPSSNYWTDLQAELFDDPSQSPLFNARMASSQEIVLTRRVNDLWEYTQQNLNQEKLGRFQISDLDWFGFFSPEGMGHWLSLFWTRWSQHCPIINRSTFNLGDCSVLLLATMCLIGACMSTEEDHDYAKRFLDVIEELIFLSPVLVAPSPLTAGENILYRRQDVQTLQATCLMCLLQKWEGDAAAKLRMQRYRFTEFVAAARAIGISSATHAFDKFEPTIGIREWRTFVLREEMIRTFNHMFLLDSGFVIFHNSSPRIVLREMVIDLPCSEAKFQAASLDEYIQAMSSYPLDLSSYHLVDCVQTLCAEIADDEVLNMIRSETDLSLFTIVTALHGLLFHQFKALSPLSPATEPFKRALHRWDEAWDSRSREFLSTDRTYTHRTSSFFSHAKEFASLARVHVERFQNSQAEWAIIPRTTENTPTASNLGVSTFDQTNMDKIASLISAVKGLDLA